MCQHFFIEAAAFAITIIDIHSLASLFSIAAEIPRNSRPHVSKELSTSNFEFWYLGNFTNTHANFHLTTPSFSITVSNPWQVEPSSFFFQCIHSGQLHPHTKFGMLTKHLGFPSV